MIPSIGGRRFILTLGCGVACSFLVYQGKITDIVFRDLILGTVGVYVAANTYQKVKAPGT